jgi:hypothetical protein
MNGGTFGQSQANEIQMHAPQQPRPSGHSDIHLRDVGPNNHQDYGGNMQWQSPQLQNPTPQMVHSQFQQHPTQNFGNSQTDFRAQSA